jgi:tRNA(Ile)-lysidine synthase
MPGAPEVPLVRPLLALSRAALRDYLVTAGLTWREDATNQDTDRTRNAIRQDILPRLVRLNPNIAAVLAATAERLAAEAARAGQTDAAAFDNLLVGGDAATGSLAFDLKRLLAADLATRRGVLRLALQRLGVDGRDAGHAAIERILARVGQDAASGGPYPLLDHIVWSVVGATSDRVALLSLHRRDALPLPPTQPLVAPNLALPISIPVTGVVPLSEGWELHSVVCTPDDLPADWRDRHRPWRAFLDAGIAADLALTVPVRAMRVAPLGMAGHTRSLGDLFTDHKVPAAYRRGWPVVVDAAGGDVVWVCGLVLGERAALRPETRRVRCLAWQKREAQLL